MNDVNGFTFTAEGRSARECVDIHVIYGNPLGRGARSQNKRQSSQASQPSGSSTNILATRLEKQMEAA